MESEKDLGVEQGEVLPSVSPTEIAEYLKDVLWDGKYAAKRAQISESVLKGTCIWAAFVAILRQADGTYLKKILSFGIGSKSLPRSSIGSKSLVAHQIVDQHAEVLAKRGLVRFLMEQVAELLCQSTKTTLQPSKLASCGSTNQQLYLLELKSKPEEKGHPILRLRKGCKIGLVCSRMPCGDFSILDQDDDLGKASQVTYSNAQTVISYFSECGMTKSLISDNQEPFQFRLKPARRDLPTKEKYPCLSCSDKILRWQTYGLQGALLSSHLQPVRLSYLLLPAPAIVPQPSPSPSPSAATTTTTTKQKVENSTILRVRAAAIGTAAAELLRVYTAVDPFVARTACAAGVVGYHGADQPARADRLTVAFVAAAAAEGLAHGLMLQPPATGKEPAAAGLSFACSAAGRSGVAGVGVGKGTPAAFGAKAAGAEKPPRPEFEFVNPKNGLREGAAIAAIASPKVRTIYSNTELDAYFELHIRSKYLGWNSEGSSLGAVINGDCPETTVLMKKYLGRRLLFSLLIDQLATHQSNHINNEKGPDQ